MNPAPWNRLEPSLLVQALGDVLSPGHLARLLPCLGFGLLALVLAISTAKALRASPGSRLERMTRWLALAFTGLPPAAPALALAGWASARGWPVPSLMPTEHASDLAHFLWLGLPPLLLLTALLTLEQLAASGRFRRCFTAIAGAWLLSDALDLFQGLATPARAILADHPVRFAQVLVEITVLAIVAVGLAILRSPPPRPGPNANRRQMEGALALGHPPWTAWRRHRLPDLIRHALAGSASLLAWAVVAVTSTALLVPLPGLERWHEVGTAFLEQPAGVLTAIWPALLCALSLRLVGRMLARPSAVRTSPPKP